MKPVDLRQSWNNLSPHYQKDHLIRTHAAHYGPYVADESQLRLLGDVAGKRILELGCGGAQCSIAFAKQGAICTGVDLSDSQIAFARSLAEQEGVSVALHREEMIAFLQSLPDAAFDIVFSAYAFQYVEDLASVFRETLRVLKQGGIFVFSLDHPIKDITAQENGRIYLTDSYFALGRMDWEWPHGAPGNADAFYSFHRTTGDLVNLLAQAGFRIEKLLEPEPVAEEEDPWKSMEDFEGLCMLPTTILFQARKPAC